MDASFKAYVEEFEAELSDKELAAFNTLRAHYEAENEWLREALGEMSAAETFAELEEILRATRQALAHTEERKA